MDFHWLRLRATVHPTEDLAKVRLALAHAARLAPEDMEKHLSDVQMPTHHGGTQHLLEVSLRRNKDCRAALEAMVRPVAAHVAATLEERVDDDGVLYVRLDKQEASAGRLVVGVHDDPVSVRAKVQVHPASRERAMAVWQDWLGTLSSPAL